MRTRIVPVEPSEEMIAGVEDPFVGTVKMNDVIRDIYAATLAAAPPVSEELVEKVTQFLVDRNPMQTARAILDLINGESE